MDKKIKIKAIMFLYFTLGITIYIFSDHEYKNDNYIVYQNDEEPFGAYKNGNIYIGDHNYIEGIKDKIKDGDVLIEQGYRTQNDPNYKIYSSYLIKDREDRNAILNVLKIYNAVTNFDFDRSLDSMRVEWSIHNLLYNFGIEKNRTRDVDLNNDDEKIYSNPVLKKIIK